MTAVLVEFVKELLAPESIQVEEQQEVLLVDEGVQITLGQVIVDEFQHANFIIIH